MLVRSRDKVIHGQHGQRARRSVEWRGVGCQDAGEAGGGSGSHVEKHPPADVQRGARCLDRHRLFLPGKLLRSRGGFPDPSEAIAPSVQPVVELVASFVNRSNLLKSWEKTETCAGSASGVYEPKKRGDHAHSRPIAATESHHFSDRTALV